MTQPTVSIELTADLRNEIADKATKASGPILEPEQIAAYDRVMVEYRHGGESNGTNPIEAAIRRTLAKAPNTPSEVLVLAVRELKTAQQVVIGVAGAAVGTHKVLAAA